MKVRLTAGAELDMLTRDELASVLQSWRTELTRGVRTRRVSIAGAVDAAGNLLMGDGGDGPNESLAWAVTRISVAPGPVLPLGGLQVFANDTSSAGGLLIAALTGDVFPGDRGLVLMPGDSLRITGSGLVAATQVMVTAQVKEVPVQQVWSL